MYYTSETLANNSTVLSTPDNQQASEKYASAENAHEELERGVKAALETYSNVHRGTGHYSMITTELFERARDIVIDYLGLNKKEYLVIFGSDYRSRILEEQLHSENYFKVSSRDIGLPLGLRALAVNKSALPKDSIVQTGGGTVKIVSPDSVIWEDAPQKYEAGTPSILNAITLAITLKLSNKFGTDCFKVQEDSLLSATEILYEDDLSEYSGSQLLVELRKQFVGRNLLVPTADGNKSYINLDNAASTPTFFPVWNVARKVWPLSEKVYPQIVREVKKIISGFLGASMEKYDTIFTSNTTEAINIAARFIQNEFQEDSGLVILNTIQEHNSNELPWRYIPGASQIRLSVDNEGFIDLDELELLLRRYNHEGIYGKKRIRIVAITGVSNVTGAKNDMHTISKIVHEYNARLLVDAAQVVAHHSINIDELDVDYLAFSGHKVYAPFGSGVLIVKKEYIHIDPSELSNIRTSGEENIIGIATLGKALILLQRVGMKNIEARETILSRRLLKGMTGMQGIKTFGVGDSNSNGVGQLGSIVSFRMKGVPHNLVAKELAELGGIGVRNGCFCAHLFVKHLLHIHRFRALAADAGLILTPKLTNVFLPGLVRVSFGLENDENEVDRLIQVLERIVGAPRSIINRLLAFNRNGTPFLSSTTVQQDMEKFLDTRIQKVYSLNSDRL